MCKVLWIIGAGASVHLGMPLLSGFDAFFRELWDEERFPENRNDPELQETLPPTIQFLESRRHLNENIEDVLVSNSVSIEMKAILRRAIRRGFERRNLGRIWKVYGRPGKLGPYSRLLGLMQSGDAVVSFNYDNALEAPLCVAHGDFATVNQTELDSAQRAFLSGRRALTRWIPSECIDSLTERSLEYVPNGSFLPESTRRIGGGAISIPIIKIHGSMNWFDSSGRIRVGNSNSADEVPMLTYPEPGKPELSRPPQQQLVDESIRHLRSCGLIVLIGYSFPPSDAEGHPFVSAVSEAMQTISVLALDPSPSLSLASRIADRDIIRRTFEDATRPDGDAPGTLQVEVENRR